MRINSSVLIIKPCAYTVRSIYCIFGTIFIILAADQNIFKLQLYRYNEYELKVHALIFNLRVFTSKLEEKLRNYSSLICTSPILRDHNWTIDSNHGQMWAIPA